MLKTDLRKLAAVGLTAAHKMSKPKNVIRDVFCTLTTDGSIEGIFVQDWESELQRKIPVRKGVPFEDDTLASVLLNDTDIPGGPKAGNAIYLGTILKDATDEWSYSTNAVVTGWTSPAR